MHDYFKEFLIPRAQAVKTLAEAATEASTGMTLSSLKPHIVWALIAAGIGFASWKAGKWYTSYELLKQRTTQG